MLDCYPDLNKDEITQILQDLINNPPSSSYSDIEYNAEPEEEPNNAEPHNNDNLIHESLRTNKDASRTTCM